MLRNESLVCLSITPWDTHLPSSGHYLMREFARKNRVLFVDRPLSVKDLWNHRRNPEMADRLARTLRQENPLRPWGLKDRDGWVLTPPPILPINALDEGALYETAFATNTQLLRRSVRWAMDRLDMRDPILWVSFELPMGAGLLGKLDERLSVYHCFDEVRGEPYLARHGQLLEARLVEHSDIVFASSRKLAQDRLSLRPDIQFVPNGVDFESYRRAMDLDLPIPDDLSVIPPPRIGYLGNLESRLDYALIENVAIARPDWSIVLVGPSEGYWQEKLEIMGKLSNVYVLGKRPPSMAPAILKAFDAAIIPFVRSPQTEAIYPLKLNEYLAAGRSVVMTPFADLREFQHVTWIASDAPSFIAALEAAIRPVDPASLSIRLQVARDNDWSRRAAAIETCLERRLNAHPPLPGRRNLA